MNSTGARRNALWRLRPSGVMGVTFGIGVADGPVGAPLVHEFRCLDRAIVQVGAIAPDLGVGHREGIPGPHIEHEVDVPAEDVRESDRGLIMGTCRLHCLEQRAVDRAVDGARAHVYRVLQHIGLEGLTLT